MQCMHYAARTGQLLVLDSLIREGQNVNVRTCDGVTALHDASWTGHAICAKHLIKAGAKASPLQVSLLRSLNPIIVHQSVGQIVSLFL